MTRPQTPVKPTKKARWRVYFDLRFRGERAGAIAVTGRIAAVTVVLLSCEIQEPLFEIRRSVANEAITEADCPTDYRIVKGTPEADVLEGSNISDCILGYGGDDVIKGGPGPDFLAGGSGDDQIEGGAGNDWLFGESGDDHLRGMLGSDVLHGGEGRDELAGGGENDSLLSDAEVIDRGEGV